MSAKIESDRRSFHRQQMDLLPTLIPGLDPDPPVQLCDVTRAFDRLILVQLKRNGWPATGKTREQFEADPPAPVKGAVLAKKLARGNGLTLAQIELLTARIKWLQRNPFRWEARDGYAAVAAAKVGGEAVQELAEAIKGEANSACFDASATANSGLDFVAQAASGPGPVAITDDTKRHDLGPAETAPERATSATGNSSQSDLWGTGSGAENRGRDEAKGRPAKPDFSAATEKCDAAIAALAGGSETSSSPSFEDYAKAVGESHSDPDDARFISLRTRQIKSFEGEKVRNFLFSIFYRKSYNEIERCARALAADKAQLSAAMSGARSTREDILEAFAKLGLEANV